MTKVVVNKHKKASYQPDISVFDSAPTSSGSPNEEDSINIYYHLC